MKKVIKNYIENKTYTIIINENESSKHFRIVYIVSSGKYNQISALKIILVLQTSAPNFSCVFLDTLELKFSIEFVRKQNFGQTCQLRYLNNDKNRFKQIKMK